MQELKIYILEQIECIPHNVYVALFQILCVVSVTLIIWKGWKNGIRYTLWFLWGEYLLLIFCSTVIYREVSDVHPVHFQLFWSYFENSTGEFEVKPEHIMNVLMFVPAGALISILNKKYVIMNTLLLGVAFSCSIEGLQFLFFRGTCEVDDVMNNTMGCLIGYMVVCGARKMIRCLKR